MIPKTRGNVVIPAQQTITFTRTTRTQPINTKFTWTTEADGDTCTRTQEMRDFTHTCDPDSNSRKVTGQRITTISDQVSHLSETKPTENGTRRLTLDHTHWMGPSNTGSTDVDNYNGARPTIHYPTRHSSALTNQRKDTPRMIPGTTDSCTDYT